MKAIIALLLGVAYATFDQEFTVQEWVAADAKALWADWMIAFDKSYDTLEEESYRFGLWEGAMDYIAEMNSAGHTFKLRMNQFGALTDEEFKMLVHGTTGSCLKPPMLEDAMQATDGFAIDEPVNAPASVDWQAAGDVTPVKNQGQCGSCWAFATTGSVECDWSINKGTLTSLSEQELVDCTRSYGNAGCNGGWWYNAYKYIIAEKGLCSETEYPYTARDGTCRDSSCGTKYDAITSYTKVTPDSDTALMNAVATGCVAVGVEADQSAWQYYSSGVLTGTCGANIDHGVLAVGYGTSGSQEYWRVKNSWGTSWGQKGYILVCRNCNKNGSKGECGINMYPYLTT